MKPKQTEFEWAAEARENDLMTMSSEKLERIMAETRERHAREAASWPVRTIALVACSKTKLSVSAPARELYQGMLFKRASEYAELIADEWFILSAKHRLVEPDRLLAPYDFTMRMRHGAQSKYLWALCTANDLGAHKLGRGSRIIMLAGTDYVRYLRPILEERGFRVDCPLTGYGYGEQVSWIIGRLEEHGV